MNGLQYSGTLWPETHGPQKLQTPMADGQVLMGHRCQPL
jgi:hypothetical protein